jgi:phosphatidylglycerol lysyltransferase
VIASEEELAAAQAIVAQSPDTTARLALLGDKRLLFNDSKTALVMFGVEGRSWISLGDPVGPDDQARELVWRFLEMCDENGAWPVFYQADAERLAWYVDPGLSMLKLGEEARVPLSEFQLEGRAHKSLRHASEKLLEQGCVFEIVPAARVEEILAEMKAVSDAWLASKDTAEKGFSLGFFDEAYLRRFPVAVVRYEGQMMAFANLWLGAGREELSVDLMRHLPDAPHGMMDFLFAQIMLWGKCEGFAWFNLGMAPLSGIEAQRLGPLWNKVASLAYRHGEHFYNFEGLREYKEKFDPVWRPKYLASPGGMALPVILGNLTTLVSGGVLRLVSK